jgi:tRNA 2-selenouridine synthase
MKAMVEAVESILVSLQHKVPQPETPNSKLVLLYCWRGGMRSGAVAWLLDLYGFKIYTLAGGYKKFRNHVLDSFKKNYSFKILGGYTGSGKTETLKELARKGEAIIDLEEIAKHKGSAFGNIGLPQQPTQEMFENLLAYELNRLQTEGSGIPLLGGGGAWLEDESQRIGLVNIPNDIWKIMRASPVYFLDIPFEERLKHITEEYGQLDKQKMVDAIGRIKDRLGGLETKNAISHLEGNNTIESFRILLKYYDKWYDKALHNRENINSLLHTVNCEFVTPENAKKLVQQPVYHEKP